jgi:hypothetical protein
MTLHPVRKRMVEMVTLDVAMVEGWRFGYLPTDFLVAVIINFENFPFLLPSSRIANLP